MIKNVEIKKALLEQNLPIKELAKQIGYTRSHVSGVINGRYDSPKVKKSIALVLRKDFNFLWSADSNAAQANKTT